MAQEEIKSYNILKPAEELKRLIIKNPELPVIIFAGENAHFTPEAAFTLCWSIKASVGEVLDSYPDFNLEVCYTDRAEFEKDVAAAYAKEQEKFDGLYDVIGDEIAKHEPYWKPCIIAYVDN